MKYLATLAVTAIVTLAAVGFQSARSGGTTAEARIAKALNLNPPPSQDKAERARYQELLTCREAVTGAAPMPPSKLAARAETDHEESYFATRITLAGRDGYAVYTRAGGTFHPFVLTPYDEEPRITYRLQAKDGYWLRLSRTFRGDQEMASLEREQGPPFGDLYTPLGEPVELSQATLNLIARADLKRALGGTIRTLEAELDLRRWAATVSEDGPRDADDEMDLTAAEQLKPLFLKRQKSAQACLPLRRDRELGKAVKTLALQTEIPLPE